MRQDVKAAIEEFYQGKAYTNPLDGRIVFPPERRKLIYDIIGELKHRVGRNITHAADGQYDLSEKIVIRDHIVLRISFLGPFAFLSAKLAKRHFSDSELTSMTHHVKEVLDMSEVLLLSEDDTVEEVPWLEAGDSLVGGKVRVWNCLFCEY